ncbi:MAG: hypothetical protein OXI30_18965 [Chloroflexota bacterium]|nr:hypothetical protein [Chloroflexota bacterium]
MLQIAVMLEVPLKIALGLASGQLELNGGVVVDAASKQVVMWLREGGNIANNPDLAGGLLNTLSNSATGGLTSTATNLLSSAVSAQSHFLIMRELHSLTSLVGLVGGIGLLNLAATAISTGIILKRINDLEQLIRDLGVEIAKQFEEDRAVKMSAAINAADLAFTMEGQENRNTQAHLALDKLFAARQHIWMEINTLKGSSRYAKNNELMQKNVEQAMRLDALYSRCLLELENISLAKTYLERHVRLYRETTVNLVHRYLGTHRAVYFHNSIRESDLLRYIFVEHWLSNDENRLLTIILGNRRDFWSTDIADNKGIKKPGKDHYLNALTQSELLIANLHQFHGFHAEIEAIERLGIPYAEWEKRQEEALAKANIDLAEHDDYVLLVDKGWLTEQSDSPAA